MNEVTQSGAAVVVQQIFDETGAVTASELVRRAKPKDSPAHNHFEWDDSKAGHQYRLHQARHIIRRVVITREERQERLLHVPLIREPEGGDENADDGKANGGTGCTGEGYYTTPSVLVTRPDEAARAVREIKAQLSGLTQKLEQAEKILDPKDKRLKTVKSVSGKVRNAEREMDAIG